MKYLIDHRYKVIHSVKITVASILSICERGRSKELQTKLDFLAKFLPEIKTMMAPPFNEKTIGQLKKLHADTEDFLLLEGDLNKKGRKLIQSIKPILSTIDPFHFTDEETPNIRRSQIIELTQNLQARLQRHILDLKGKATSLSDEKTSIQELFDELILISLDPFTEKETSTLQELFTNHLIYQKEPTLPNAKLLLNQAILIESLFKNPAPKQK